MEQKKILQILVSLARESRCCSQDEAFCAGVTFHQFIILDAVAKKKEIHLSDLHIILSVEKSTTTRLINPLIKKRLLKRVKADHDSRAAKLILTPKGLETYKKVWSCLSAFLIRIIKHIPEGRLDEVLGSVKLFADAMRGAITGSSCCR